MDREKFRTESEHPQLNDTAHGRWSLVCNRGHAPRGGRDRRGDRRDAMDVEHDRRRTTLERPAP